MKKLIDLYPYRLFDKKISFLLFQRSQNIIYSGQWRMVGGKVRQDETRWKAALRELKEETGLTPELFWAVPTINHFYEHKTDTIHLIPPFAARIANDVNIKLDNEHQSWKWIESEQIKNYIFWPEQKRIIELIHSIVQKDQILKDWIIKPDHT